MSTCCQSRGVKLMNYFSSCIYSLNVCFAGACLLLSLLAGWSCILFFWIRNWTSVYWGTVGSHWRKITFWGGLHRHWAGRESSSSHINNTNQHNTVCACGCIWTVGWLDGRFRLPCVVCSVCCHPSERHIGSGCGWWPFAYVLLGQQSIKNSPGTWIGRVLLHWVQKWSIELTRQWRDIRMSLSLLYFALFILSLSVRLSVSLHHSLFPSLSFTLIKRASP